MSNSCIILRCVFLIKTLVCLPEADGQKNRLKSFQNEFGEIYVRFEKSSQISFARSFIDLESELELLD